MTRTLLAAGVLALALAAPALAADHDMSTMGQPGPAYDSRGLGPVHHPVTTRSPEAQRLFDQGLALCFAFNHDEAVRSFTRAARADSALAMAWWGIAYALGPNINLPVDSARSVQAYAAVQRAQALAAGASSAEQDYIAAMARRYAAVPPADRSSLDAAFRVAMRDVMQAHPDDPDAAAIYAESIMDLTPWNYWGRDGKPLRPDTDELVAVLEGLLAKHPDHPAANHYYIHAVEGSAHPERALVAAARLRTLAPDAGHLVHMPSHVMDRVGDYWEAAELNVKAAGVDSAYVARQHVEGIYPLMYWTHNRDFAASAFTRCGRYADALRYARTVRRTAEEAAPAMTMAEGFGDRPLFVQVVFHRWPAVLATPRPDSILVVTR
ncbi:MAG TPA: hypothetical protein VGU27_08380, partial [Candidatus Eisenbacteria bacterium]|nr:hypothetical protein [Candidatus Eisenbacteria bacterium]